MCYQGWTKQEGLTQANLGLEGTKKFLYGKASYSLSYLQRSISSCQTFKGIESRITLNSIPSLRGQPQIERSIDVIELPFFFFKTLQLLNQVRLSAQLLLKKCHICLRRIAFFPVNHKRGLGLHRVRVPYRHRNPWVRVRSLQNQYYFSRSLSLVYVAQTKESNRDQWPS